MIEAETTDGNILGSLSRSLDEWVCRGNEQPLTRWLKRELSSEGVLVRLTLPSWRECLSLIAGAQAARSGWPSQWEELVTRLVQTNLRFTRPDGSTATDFAGLGEDAGGPDGSAKSKTRGSRPRANGSAGMWLVQRKGEHPGARDAWSSADRVLAVLLGRCSDGGFSGHRSPSCKFRVPVRAVRSRPLLAGTNLDNRWTGHHADASAASPGSQPRTWLWRNGPRERRTAADAVDGLATSAPTRPPERARREADDLAAECRCPCRLSVETRGRAERTSRAIQLTESHKKGSAQILPIGLPCASYATDRGNFQVDRAELVLKQAANGRKCWLPLLVSWDAARNRKDLHWRILTVSERSRIVSPDRAFAVRVSWGRHETYVIYRSLGPPGIRAFLGHQTRARFLIGLFTNDATVEPILEII